jgi:hypothetical protein
MNLLNNHDPNIHDRRPIWTFHRKRRGFPFPTYNDRSAEIVAMNAHLRAAAYGGESQMQPTGNKSARSLLNLSREYDDQARDNFTKEAMIFALITIVAVAWPFIHGMQVLAL